MLAPRESCEAQCGLRFLSASIVSRTDRGRPQYRTPRIFDVDGPVYPMSIGPAITMRQGTSRIVALLIRRHELLAGKWRVHIAMRRRPYIKDAILGTT